MRNRGQKADIPAQQSGRERKFPPPQSFSSIPPPLSVDLMSPRTGRGQCASLNAPVQMLMSSGNTLTETPRSSVLSGHSLPNHLTSVESKGLEIRADSLSSFILMPLGGLPADRAPQFLVWRENTSYPRLRLISPLLSSYLSASIHCVPWSHIKKKKILKINLVCLDFPGLESQSDLFQVAGKHAFSRTVTLSREEDTHCPAPRLFDHRPRSRV